MYLGTNPITQGRGSAYSIDTTDLRPSICRKNITLAPSEQAAQWGNRFIDYSPRATDLASMVFKLTPA